MTQRCEPGQISSKYVRHSRTKCKFSIFLSILLGVFEAQVTVDRSRAVILRTPGSPECCEPGGTPCYLRYFHSSPPSVSDISLGAHPKNTAISCCASHGPRNGPRCLPKWVRTPKISQFPEVKELLPGMAQISPIMGAHPENIAISCFQAMVSGMAQMSPQVGAHPENIAISSCSGIAPRNGPDISPSGRAPRKYGNFLGFMNCSQEGWPESGRSGPGPTRGLKSNCVKKSCLKKCCF